VACEKQAIKKTRGRKTMTETDWQEFRKKYRAAAAFIDQRELENELAELRDLAWLNAYQSRRLNELEALPHIAQAVNAKQ
jgi:tryptophan 2,3-dioxygenase